MLKLPKDVTAGPRHDAILKILTSNSQPLWEKSPTEVPHLALTQKLAIELRWAMNVGFGIQGLEQAANELARQEKGLASLAEKSGTPQNPTRISRILFVANDGAERFYRECDSLLALNPQRLLVCRLQASGDQLGEAVFGIPKLLRALLINDKKAAAKILLSLI